MTEARCKGPQSNDICIVGGAGHVGLPLALTFATRGFRVLVYDKNEEVLHRIEQGEMPYDEENGQSLLDQTNETDLLTLSSDPASVEGADTVIITIGTPVDEFMNPVFKVIKNCADELLPYLSDDQLMVLRSTVYPGTTDWFDSYLKTQGRSLRVSYCPERVVQGHAIEEIQSLPHLVSGTTNAAEEAAAELFGSLTDKIVRLSPMEAEFAKLFHNSYRYIKFAVANQFYMIANGAGVDYNRVLDGMKQDYPRDSEIPRAGFTAGPCLLKDTLQLAAFSNNQFTLGHTAMVANEGLVLYLVEEIKKRFGDLGSKTVGLLGMAFKADSGDTRASLSYKLKKMLSFHAQAVLTHDAHVQDDPDLNTLDEVMANSDLLILCVPHSDYSELQTGDKPIIDIWGYL